MKNKIPFLCMLVGSIGIADSVITSFFSNFNLGTFFPGLLGAILLILGLFHDYLAQWSKFGWRKYVMKTLKIGFYLFLISFLAIMSVIVTNSAQEPWKNADAIVVLGAGLHGERVSQTLSFRLDEAKKYYEENNRPIILVTGSQGPQELVTEASAMKKYLLAKGIPEDHILTEEEAHNTRQNFIFSKKILDQHFQNQEYKIVYVTNYFHTFRAGLLAKKAGFQGQGAGAKVTTFLLPNFYIREYFSVLKYLALDSWQ